MARLHPVVWFAPFDPAHLRALTLAHAQSELETRVTERGYGAALAVEGLAWTAICGSGVCGAGGVLPQWEGRAICWALVGNNVPWRAWGPITRKARATLEAAHARGYRRLECSVACGHAAADRWAVRLGFAGEGLMRAYSPEGRDFILAAKLAPERTAA